MQKSWASSLENKIIMSSAIFPIDKFGAIGKVHSVFAHSFNIAAGRQMINAADNSSCLSSFGLSLPAPWFQKVRSVISQGDVVKLRRDQLIFYSRKGIRKIGLKDAELLNLKVEALKAEKTQLTAFKASLEKRQLEKKIGLPITSEALLAFRTLTAGGTAFEQERTVTYLIGRGKGLTPSGDDVLLGYLFILKIFDVYGADRLALLLKKCELSTTDISIAYMNSSIQGVVNAPVFQLFQDLKDGREEERLDADIKRIMEIGHTSGADICFGMLLGVRRIINRVDAERGE